MALYRAFKDGHIPDICIDVWEGREIEIEEERVVEMGLDNFLAPVVPT